MLYKKNIYFQYKTKQADIIDLKVKCQHYD